MKLRGFLLCLLLPMQLQAHDKASEQAHYWLDRMAKAVKRLNYEGVFVYLHDNRIESMQLIHRADREGEQERLLSLNGVAREIIRDRNSLICILPDSRSVVVEKSRSRKYIPSALLNDTGRLEKFYRFRVVSSGRIAGRDAQVVAVIPKDGYRYGYRLWIDRKTGLLLMSDLINERGEVVEKVMFTVLRIHDKIPKERVAQTIHSKGYRRFQLKAGDNKAHSRQHNSPWKVMRLPRGFMMTVHASHGMPTSKGQVEHLMFTDGLASVSVYIEKSSGKPALRGASRMAAVNAWGGKVNGYNVTVVGEVPRATVEMIGKSLRYTKAR